MRRGISTFLYEFIHPSGLLSITWAPLKRELADQMYPSSWPTSKPLIGACQTTGDE
jgi:hypothetical protein